MYGHLFKHKKHKSNGMGGLVGTTVGLGVASMAGMSAMGAMSNTPGMPQEGKNIVPIAGAGLGVVNAMNTARIGMSLGKMMGKKKW